MNIHEEPKIIAFLCKWCSYTGADLAGTSRFSYPPNVKIIQVPCSGRIDPVMLFKAFVEGYDGVMVSGCHPGDCHYGTGNYFAKRKLALARRLLEHVGIEKERMFFTWVSASEGKKFASVCAEFTAQLKKMAGKPKSLAREGVAQ